MRGCYLSSRSALPGEPFAKIQALGNDFIWFLKYVDGEPPRHLLADIPLLCHRHRGIGSDGVIFWGPARGNVYPLWFFNRDGSAAEVCGNGLRALCVAGRDLDLVRPGEVWFEISGERFPVEAPQEGNIASVGLGIPHIPRTGSLFDDVREELRGMDGGGGLIYVPNPHIVVFEEMAKPEGEREKIAAKLSALLPEGANVGFVCACGKHRLNLEVWERGVGRTLACGSGAGAAWAIAIDQGLLEGAGTVHQPGGDLLVDQRDDERLWISGEASLIFTGSLPWAR